MMPIPSVPTTIRLGNAFHLADVSNLRLAERRHARRHEYQENKLNSLEIKRAMPPPNAEKPVY